MSRLWFPLRPPVFTRFFQTIACRVRRLLQHLFQEELREVRCVSVVHGHSLNLPREFVHNASHMHLELTVRRPILARLTRQAVQVQPQTLDGRNLPDLVLSQVETVGHRRLTQVRIQLAAPALAKQPGFRMVVVAPRSGKLLGTFELHKLSESALLLHYESLVLRNLQVEEHSLWIESGHVRHRADLVPANSDAVTIELTLRSAAINDWMPEWTTTLSLSALSANQRLPLGHIPVTLKAKPGVTTTLSVPVRDSALASLPAGLCWLVASVAGRDMAVFPFRLVREQELIDQLQVSQVFVDARAPDGRYARNVRVLRREQCRWLDVSLVISTGILAPNSVFTGSVAWSRANAVVHRETFHLRLDRWSQRLSLQPLELTALGLTEHLTPDDLTLAVYFGDDLRFATRLLVLPEQRITNFEGQLRLDPADLDVHDAEYEDILKRLDPHGHSLSRRLF